MTLLRVNRAVAEIAGSQVLRQVSVDIAAGETLALIGRNGAGKTSLLRVIMGALPLVHGSVEFNGRNIAMLPAHDRVGLGIGYAPEERRLIGKFTVRENILLPAWAGRLGTAEIQERLELIYFVAPELKDLSARLGGLLSGGQQKMVALGRALMAGKHMVLLDEPFQGLAPALALKYADMLRALRDARPDLAVLVTESNPQLLQPMADRMIVLERGEIQAEATEKVTV
ncbi:ABC transporter ATP-binding protein [Parapusillimonas sp. JC17]|uniref:ABC transporter ATP-binding protein n=1 Tax=Parapusillimonas sp. JC17 TaxID=3445768 RepID=UPI003F9FBF69